MNDAPPPATPDSEDASRRFTKIAVWTFAAVELLVMILAFAFRTH